MVLILSASAGLQRKTSFGDYLPGNMVRFKNGRGALVRDLGGGKIGFHYLPGKLTPDDIARIPLYDPKDDEAKAGYLAAARRSKMSYRKRLRVRK